ncbi:MAG: AMP-binding protein [Chloroflexi bacterium]|nr:AMP-binding protein [Chloroflexota bacterium]
MVCGDTRLTYAQLGDRADRLADGLATLGIRDGMRVAVLERNCHRYMEVYFAAARLGAILVPLNTRLSSRELSAILVDCEPRQRVERRAHVRTPPPSQHGQVPSYRVVLDREGVSGLGDIAIVGREDAVAEQLERLAELGVTDLSAFPSQQGRTVTPSM